MTDPDPGDFGYMPCLWLPAARHWLRPDGLSICTHEVAVAEIAEKAATPEPEAEPR
jgi:hypothetical protein